MLPMNAPPPVRKGKGRPSAASRGHLPPFLRGIQEPGPRLRALVEKHGIAHILKAMNSEKYLADNFSAYDGLLIMGLANGLKGDGVERERLLDRMFGKVPDRAINVNLNLETDPSQLSDKALELLARLTPMIEDDSDLVEE